MTTRAPQGSIRDLLTRRHHSVRVAHALHAALRGAALAILPLALAVVLGALVVVGVGGAWARLALLVAVWLGCLAWAVFRFLANAPRLDPFLELAEQRFPDLRSWLRNAADFSASQDRSENGTSAELTGAVLAGTARRIERLPLDELRPALRPAKPLTLILGSAALLVIVALIAPRQVERSWRTLWNPELAAPPITLAVEPGSVKVTPGASLAVFARVGGTSRRPRITRLHGDPVDGIAAGSSSEGHLWRFDLAQLTRDDEYQVSVASAESPRYQITMAGEPAPVSFEVEYHAPAYARLSVQRGSSLSGDLSALRGSRARVTVTFDRDLSRLEAVRGARHAAWNALTPRRWQGELAIDGNGEYALHAVASQGEGTFRYRISALGDAPPLLAVRVPTGDLDLPAGQQVPVELMGQDDLGLTELSLEYRRDTSEPWRPVPLASFPSRPREAEVRARWDASPLGLLPGQSAVFRFVLYDDNAIGGRGRAESPTFELRFPSLAELYDDIDDSQGRVQRTLEKVAEQSRELQESLDKLSRQPPQRSAPQQPAFERSEELRSTLERQQELARQLDDASNQLRQSLTKAEEREAFTEELSERLRELAKLMDQVQSKEFREALERMREAMEKLDRQTLENQLPQWRQENREMLKNIERQIELLKQLRKEEQIQALAQRAEELKALQDQLNREHEAGEQSQKNAQQSKDGERQADGRAQESKERGDRQEQAARETEQLAQDIERMAGESQQEGQSAMEETAQELEQEAAQPQHQAAESARQQENSQARQQGQRASQSLQKAAQRMRSLMSQSQQQRAQVDAAAVRRAAQDLVSIQRESDENLSDNQAMSERANRQTDLSEGVARVADSLFTLSQRSPFISPKLGEALGRARNQLSQSGKDLGAGNRARGEQLGNEAGAALNEAVLELRATEDAMCKMPGQGEGQQQGTGQRMADVGQKQQQLNQRSRSLAQQLSQQMRIAAGDRSELERLSQEQSRLREQLQQIQRDDETRRELLGRLDAAEREMKEVEEMLRQGQLGGDLEEKQTRILSRLLDAQRSVNQRDFDPEREARAGEEIDRASAPEIPEELMRETDRLRLDLLRAESDRYPAQYRAYIEAYLRSLNGSRR